MYDIIKFHIAGYNNLFPSYLENLSYAYTKFVFKEIYRIISQNYILFLNDFPIFANKLGMHISLRIETQTSENALS